MTCEVLVRSMTLLLCCLWLPAVATAKKASTGEGEAAPSSPPQATELPPAVELIAAASTALGGERGGHHALAALPGYRLTYRMQVSDTWAGKQYTAEHVYEKGLDGSIKLEVDVVDGDGKDSVAFAGAEEAWVEADGERTEFARDEVLARIDDFAAETLFQVPLDLATRAIESLPEAVRNRLVTEPLGEDEAPGRYLVRALDDDGEEQLRMLLDAETSHLVEASFFSVAGRITYRFDDYREVADGLVLPHARTFLRNGVQLSELSLGGFEQLGGGDGKNKGGPPDTAPAGG